MKTIFVSAIVAALAGPALAKPILQACMTAPQAGSVQLCACIQAAADQTLTPRDQRLAAEFFSDPDMAQEIRQSDRRSHEVFWKRYRAFGETAEAYCS